MPNTWSTRLKCYLFFAAHKYCFENLESEKKYDLSAQWQMQGPGVLLDGLTEIHELVHWINCQVLLRHDKIAALFQIRQ